jgi:hypothetical protein
MLALDHQHSAAGDRDEHGHEREDLDRAAEGQIHDGSIGNRGARLYDAVQTPAPSVRVLPLVIEAFGPALAAYRVPTST